MELATGERLKVDTGCLVAFEPTVDYDIVRVGGIKTSLFGGEGCSSRRDGPRNAYGCRRFRSRGWPIASTRRDGAIAKT